MMIIFGITMNTLHEVLGLKTMNQDYLEKINKIGR